MNWIKRSTDPDPLFYKLKKGKWVLEVWESNTPGEWSMCVLCDCIEVMKHSKEHKSQAIIIRQAYSSKEAAQQAALDYVNDLVAGWQEEVK